TVTTSRNPAAARTGACASPSRSSFRKDNESLLTLNTTMKTTHIQNLLAVTLVGALALGTGCTTTHDRPLTSAKLHKRTVERRAVDAVIWGLPLVGEDACKQASFRDGKGTYNDIVWWAKGGSWMNQSPTPNVNTRYMYFFCNTKQDGPVVVEIP